MKMKKIHKLMAATSAVVMTCCAFSAYVPIAGTSFGMVSFEEDAKINISEQEMYNDYLKLVVRDNGHYVVGTTNGNPLISSDDNKKLLFGFPDSIYTTYSTIVLDGTPYHYGEDSLDSEPVYNAQERNNVSSTTYGDIYVKQTLSFVNNVSTSREDVIEIKYEVTNNGTTAHDVGARIMLDTMLAGNDDAPFRVPGTGAVTTETEYTGENIPEYWQAFDNLEDPKVVSQGSFLRDKLNPPDKVQFTNWRNVYEQPWNYTVNTGNSNGDSAVSAIWNETSLSPGQTKTYKTYYGLSELTQDLKPPLALSIYGDNTVKMNRTKYTDFTFMSYIENVGDGAADNVYLNITLPDGIELVDNGSNEYVRRFENLAVDDVKQESWALRVHNTFAEGVYPITIACGADGIEEKVITRYVTVVKNNSNDNRISYGEEKTDLFGNGTDEWTGEDNLSFTNNSDNFTTHGWEKLWWIFSKYAKQDYYHISDNYFNMLTNGMSNNVYDNIIENRQAGWGGSCYGMSSVVSLMKAGYLTPSYWQAGAAVAHDLKKPKDSDNVENLINFYHLSQYLPDVLDVKDNFLEIHETSSNPYETDDSVVLEQMIDEAKKVKEGGLPVSVSFHWKYLKDGVGHGAGHAVIAYDVDDGSYTAADGNTYRYRVSICDPNNTKWSYLYVADEYTNWYYEDMSTVSGGANNVVKGSDNNEVKILTYAFSTPEILDIRNPETGTDRTKLKDYNKLFITNYVNNSMSISSAGQSAVVDGLSYEGDLQVHNLVGSGITTDGLNSSSTIVVPDTGEAYTITPDVENGAIHSSMTYTDYRMMVDTPSGKSATFDPSGEVSLVGNNSDYEIKLSFNDNVGNLPWFSVTAYGVNANNTSLKQAEEGMILTSDNLTDSAVVAYNRNEEVGLQFSTDKSSVHIKAVDDSTLGVYVDSDDDGTYDLLIADSGEFSAPDDTPVTTEPSDNPNDFENTTMTTTKITSITDSAQSTQAITNSGTVSNVSSISNTSGNKNTTSNSDTKISSNTYRLKDSPSTGVKGVGGIIASLFVSLSAFVATKKKRK